MRTSTVTAALDRVKLLAMAHSRDGARLRVSHGLPTRLVFSFSALHADSAGATFRVAVVDHLTQSGDEFIVRGSFAHRVATPEEAVQQLYVELGFTPQRMAKTIGLQEVWSPMPSCEP